MTTHTMTLHTIDYGVPEKHRITWLEGEHTNRDALEASNPVFIADHPPLCVTKSASGTRLQRVPRRIYDATGEDIYHPRRVDSVDDFTQPGDYTLETH